MTFRLYKNYVAEIRCGLNHTRLSQQKFKWLSMIYLGCCPIRIRKP